MPENRNILMCNVLRFWTCFLKIDSSGSLTGAVHLSNDNIGVPRAAQREWKSCVEYKMIRDKAALICPRSEEAHVKPFFLGSKTNLIVLNLMAKEMWCFHHAPSGHPQQKNGS